MKPNVQNYNTVIGNIAPESTTEFGIAAGAEDFLMSMLSDLYSDREMAMLREYAVNAIDAHREAGNPAPVEIELPSVLRPIYIVRDKGLGMTHDELEYFYTKYGASTKRESNVATGMFGIGCKSALAYTSQFTVISVKNGLKVSALIRKNEQNKAVFQVIDTVVVDEPNGLEVQIPVKNPASFNRKAEHFFRFVEAGSVLVNGEVPESLFDTELALDADKVVTSKVDTDYLVMGNVPYPVKMPNFQNLSKVLNYNTHVVARVEVGLATPAPPRESLIMDDVTTDTLHEVRRFVDENVVAYIQREIEAAPTPHEAAKVVTNWRESISSSARVRWEYQGQPITQTIGITGYEWDAADTYSRKTSSRSKSMSQEKLLKDSTLVVLNSPNRALNADEKASIRSKYEGLRVVYNVHSLNTPSELQWVDPAKTVEYVDIKPVREKKARAPRGSVQKVKYAMYDRTTGTWESVAHTDIDQNGELVYIVRSDKGFYSKWNQPTRESYRQQVATVLQELYPSLSVVLVNGTEVDRLCKLFPHAETVWDYVQGKIWSIESRLSDDAFADVGVPAWVHAEIDDPKAQELAKRIKDVQSVKSELSRRHTLLRKSQWSPSQEWDHVKDTASDLAEQVAEWQAQYPAVSLHYSVSAQDVEVVNALYYYRKNNEAATKGAQK